MGSRRLEITIVSAENLPDILRLGRTGVYAVISLNGSTKSTSTNRDGGASPRWDFSSVYYINESYLHRSGLDAVVDLYCERTLGDKLIGRVVIPIKSLFEKGIKSRRSIGYPIAGTTSCGRLYIRYSFDEKLPPPLPPALPTRRILPCRGGDHQLLYKTLQTFKITEYVEYI